MERSSVSVRVELLTVKLALLLRRLISAPSVSPPSPSKSVLPSTVISAPRSAVPEFVRVNVPFPSTFIAALRSNVAVLISTLPSMFAVPSRRTWPAAFVMISPFVSRVALAVEKVTSVALVMVSPAGSVPSTPKLSSIVMLPVPASSVSTWSSAVSVCTSSRKISPLVVLIRRSPVRRRMELGSEIFAPLFVVRKSPPRVRLPVPSKTMSPFEVTFCEAVTVPVFVI